jgi:hypothetical protein
MTTFFRKHSTPILFLLLLILLILAWLFPSAGLLLGIIFLLLSFFIASSAVLGKHNEAYRQGRIRHTVFIRNAVLEITGILFAMVLAGLLGRYIAQIATQQMDNDLIRVIAGITIGLLVGIGIGFVVKQTWCRLVKNG